MLDRYRIEIYDENKLNDITIFSDTNIERDSLSQIVHSYLPNFKGDVKAYVFDQVKKKKLSAAFYPRYSFTAK